MEDKRAQFIKELQELLGKYDCHLSCDDHWQGYSECGKDVRITVEFNDWGIKDIDLGRGIYKDSNKILD